MARAVFVAVGVLLLAATVAASSYPGCSTAADCQRHGDMGGYCNPNGYCHCSFPYFNSTQGTCELVCCMNCALSCCRTDADCQTYGDSTAYCKRVDQGGNGWCHCDPGYGNQYCTPNAKPKVISLALGSGSSGGDASITDCSGGAAHTTFQTLTISPNPPVKGQTASMVGNGTCNEAVSSGQYNLVVSLDGNQLYTHSGNVCGIDSTELPLGFGKITVYGVSCPASAGPLNIAMDVVLPTAAPPGSYDVKLVGTDQSSNMLYCMDAQFSF